MAFYSQKCSQAQTDMIQDRTHTAALCAFYQTLLFNRSMIHFYPPTCFCLSLAFLFSHFLETGCPIFCRAVCGADAEYFDLSKIFEPDHSSISAAQSGIRDGLQRTSADSNLPILFEPGQKIPTQTETQFQGL